MNRTLLLLFFTTLYVSCVAQSQNDSIIVERKWSTVYLQNGKNLSIGNLLYITKNNPPAFAEMRKAQNRFTMFFASGCLGSLSILSSVGFAATEHNTLQWGSAAAGVMLIGAALLFERSFNRHAIRGAEIHNSSLLPKTATHKLHMQFGLCQNGVGLGLRIR